MLCVHAHNSNYYNHYNNASVIRVSLGGGGIVKLPLPPKKKEGERERDVKPEGSNTIRWGC